MQPQPDFIVSQRIGRPVTLSVEHDGIPPFAYRWCKDGAAIFNGTGPMHRIEKMTVADEGKYTCTVSPSASRPTVSANIDLRVDSSPTFIRVSAHTP